MAKDKRQSKIEQLEKVSRCEGYLLPHIRPSRRRASGSLHYKGLYQGVGAASHAAE
jgi:hypothetical protein